VNLNRSLLKYTLAAPLAIIPAAVVAMVPNFALAANDVTISGVVTDAKRAGSRSPAPSSSSSARACRVSGRRRPTPTVCTRSATCRRASTRCRCCSARPTSTSRWTCRPGSKYRANFSIDPANKFRIDVEVQSKVRATARRDAVKMDEVKQHPGRRHQPRLHGGPRLSPTASKDAAGVRLAGTTGAESKYVVDGANATSPAFGTVSATIVQEFIEDVEVLEAGYDAEYGGGSGGQVGRAGSAAPTSSAVRCCCASRRASPCRASSPRPTRRCASPRSATTRARACSRCRARSSRTSCSSRSASPRAGQKNSLIQSFYRRRDKDRSGGYEDCPYENGTNDCAANGNYIDSVKFAEQKFRTGFASTSSGRTLDWQITPSTACASAAATAARFQRSSFRLPPGASPTRSAPTRRRSHRRHLARRPGRRQRHLRHQLRQRHPGQPRLRGPRRRRQARDRRTVYYARRRASRRGSSTTRTSRTSR
jgi:hypothetical protein